MKKLSYILLITLIFQSCKNEKKEVITENPKRPNIIFIMADDHATQAISAYGHPISQLAPTPNIDRIADEGAIFKNNFCTNSICGPSRAVILTGKHSHINGFRMNGNRFDGNQQTFPKLLKRGIKPPYLVNGICMETLKVLIIGTFFRIKAITIIPILFR